MNPARDEKGRFRKGFCQNPTGRPKGARDKKRRFYFQSKSRTQDCAKNLGSYAIKGGPGRGRGTKDRPAEERLAEAQQLLNALENRKGKDVPLSGILRVLKALPKRPKSTDSGTK
jgi:hypothetical protein